MDNVIILYLGGTKRFPPYTKGALQQTSLRTTDVSFAFVSCRVEHTVCFLFIFQCTLLLAYVIVKLN